MGIRPKFDQKRIDAFAMQQYREAEKKLLESLQYVGEGFIESARSMTSHEGSFEDQTGNLRSSIGYFIVKDGEIVDETIHKSDRGSEGTEGVRKAKSFVKVLKDRSGYFLYGVAGMEYANSVESKGYNVISMQADMAIVELKQILRSI